MLPNYRRCISCRKVDHKSAFWRVVRVFPSQQLQLDQGMGRSVYLCPHQTCLQIAQKKDRLGRALKVTVPEGIYQVLWQRSVANPGITQEESAPDETGRIPASESAEG